MTFFIPGEPVAKGRPRATRAGRMYTPAKTVRYESTVALFAQQAMAGRLPFDGALYMVLCATWEWPASWSAKKRAANHFKTSRPDLDNIIKACCDGMNGIVFHDDAQVVLMSPAKLYGDKPGVQIKVGVAA